MKDSEPKSESATTPLTSIITLFTNEHGWINYSDFNRWMMKRGFTVSELDKHNKTDGEVHFRYEHVSAQSFDFNGNYWNAESFKKIIDWLDQNGL